MQERRARLKAIRAAGLAESDDLSAITQPVFVANGDHDVMFASSYSADMARRLPDASLTIYSNARQGGMRVHGRVTYGPYIERRLGRTLGRVR